MNKLYLFKFFGCKINSDDKNLSKLIYDKFISDFDKKLCDLYIKQLPIKKDYYQALYTLTIKRLNNLKLIDTYILHINNKNLYIIDMSTYNIFNDNIINMEYEDGIIINESDKLKFYNNFNTTCKLIIIVENV